MFQAFRNFLIGVVVVLACSHLISSMRAPRAREGFPAPVESAAPKTQNDLYAFVFSDEKSPQELATSYAQGLRSATQAAAPLTSAPYQAYDNTAMFESFTVSAPLATAGYGSP